ncbi:NlpC/P60 family protein [Mycobacterium intracellulare]|uniref:NlpC/P60 family protein n=1 Tax=Mycobacterium intracellulare TaxID=1767 RepID=UPI001E452B13|nr:NlpC/P60 family protein [Mycobacterium intracellulare]UGU04150.1 NlpC/P60 family protein [Mycobacterium intracellulare]
MRRTRWGSSARPTARLLRPVVPSVLSVALLVCTPGLAEADPAADNLAALIANVAKANQRLQNLSAEIQTEQESVNKALVDVAGDPIAVINQVLGISATSTQVTAGLGRNFLQQLGILKPDDTGITNAAPGGVGGRIPRVYGRQATEYVIRRGMSQIGVPYSWGGGNAAGPSKGIDSGAGITGFDCSGLVLYSFAGVGIKLPHYSGSQYNLGRKIPSSQMRRGDVIFYGPGGSQHVTIYLGDGQMLEAPDIGLKVRVAPVRTSGMTPYVVRYIEW